MCVQDERCLKKKKINEIKKNNSLTLRKLECEWIDCVVGAAPAAAQAAMLAAT